MYSDLKVLIIEDDLASRALMKSILEKTFELNVLEASNPMDAFDLMKTIKPDLIILDLQMPAMDGATALGLIRKDPELKDIEVIVSSALSHAGLLVHLHRLGIADYILKPSDIRTIVYKITKVLDKVIADRNSGEQASEEIVENQSDSITDSAVLT